MRLNAFVKEVGATNLSAHKKRLVLRAVRRA